MREPPRAPRATASLPFQAIVGAIEESIRLPAPTAFASPWTSSKTLGFPGAAAKSSISLLRKKPAPGT